MPEPVGPVTKMMPLGFWISRLKGCRIVCDIIILSDRDHGRELAPIPALLACAAIHHHLLREGSRTRTCLVIESGEPREVHHFSLLIGYGALSLLGKSRGFLLKPVWIAGFVISGACLLHVIGWNAIDLTRMNIDSQGG